MGSEDEKKLLYYSKAIYLYCKKNLGRIPKMLQVEIQKKQEGPAHCPMSRPQVDVATWISLDSSWSGATSFFKLRPICLATALISGRDIEVMSRHLLFSVPSVLMSRPQLHVAASLSSYSFSF